MEKISSSPEELGRKTTKNALYSMMVNGWYLFSRFALTPFILHYLSLAEYGLWSVCFVVMSFLAFTSMGFEGTYIKYVAEYNAQEDTEQINRLLSTGLMVTVLASLLLLLLLLVGMNPLLDLLKIDVALREKTTFVFMGTAVIFMLDISFNCFARALDGCQHLALTAKIRFWASCVELACIVGLLYLGYGIYGLMLAFVFRYIIVIAANIYYAYLLIPGLKIRSRFFDMRSLKVLLTYGGKMQLLGLIGILMNTFDKLIITSLLGLSSTGLYEIGKKMPQKGARVPAEISGAIMPALSHLQGKNDFSGTRRMFLGASRYMAMLASVLFSFLALSAPYAIHVWLGPGYEGAVMVMFILSLTTLFHLLTGSSSSAARGLNKLSWELKYSIVGLVLGLTLTPLLTLYHGLAGAATGVAVSTVLSSIYFLSITNRYFKVSLLEYWKNVLHPVVATLVSALVINWILLTILSVETTGRITLFILLLFFTALHLGFSTFLLAATKGIHEQEWHWLGQNIFSRVQPYWKYILSSTRR